MMTTTVKALMTHVAPTCPPVEKCKDKISVIGAGSVGTTIAFVLLAQVSQRRPKACDFTSSFCSKILFFHPPITFTSLQFSARLRKVLLLFHMQIWLSADDNIHRCASPFHTTETSFLRPVKSNERFH